MINFTQTLFVITIVCIKFVAGLDENMIALDPFIFDAVKVVSAGSSSFGKMCVPKCCPDGMSLSEDLASNACVNRKQVATNYRAVNTMALRPINKDFCKNGKRLTMGDAPGEQLLISPDGNLVIRDKLNVDDELYTEYCIDRYNGSIIAKVCVSATSENGSVETKGYNNSYNLTEILFIEQIIPICMLISVPLFFGTALIYSIVPKLRDVHGEMLALHSILMGIGYLLMAFNKILVLENSRRYQDGIHFFILSSLGWLLMMTTDMAYNLWSYFQTAEQFQQKLGLRMTVYSVMAFGLPAIFVAASPAKNVPMHFTDNALAAIMTPISIILLINFFMFIPIYKFFVKDVPRCSAQLEVKHRAKSALWILVIIAFNWFFELISLNWPELRLSLIAFATLNSLQGVAIVFVFVLMPHYKKIIWAWWVEYKYKTPIISFDFDT